MEKYRAPIAEGIARMKEHLDTACFGSADADDARRLIEEYELPAGKWISVEERLPEIGVSVLFTTNESAIELGMRCFDDRTQIFQCERTGPRDEPITFRIKDGQVTFWQALPAPPAAFTAKRLQALADVEDEIEILKGYRAFFTSTMSEYATVTRILKSRRAHRAELARGMKEKA